MPISPGGNPRKQGGNIDQGNLLGCCCQDREFFHKAKLELSFSLKASDVLMTFHANRSVAIL